MKLFRYDSINADAVSPPALNEAAGRLTVAAKEASAFGGSVTVTPTGIHHIRFGGVDGLTDKLNERLSALVDRIGAIHDEAGVEVGGSSSSLTDDQVEALDRCLDELKEVHLYAITMNVSRALLLASEHMGLFLFDGYEGPLQQLISSIPGQLLQNMMFDAYKETNVAAVAAANSYSHFYSAIVRQYAIVNRCPHAVDSPEYISWIESEVGISPEDSLCKCAKECADRLGGDTDADDGNAIDGLMGLLSAISGLGESGSGSESESESESEPYVEPSHDVTCSPQDYVAYELFKASQHVGMGNLHIDAAQAALAEGPDGFLARMGDSYPETVDSSIHWLRGSIPVGETANTKHFDYCCGRMMKTTVYWREDGSAVGVSWGRAPSPNVDYQSWCSEAGILDRLSAQIAG